jgi:hypothetical protein
MTEKKKAPITQVRERFEAFADAVEKMIAEAPHSEQCNARLGYICSAHCWKNSVDIHALRREYNIEKKE